MTRTNIDIDDDLVNEVMHRYNLSTKKEAVNYALRRLVTVPLTKEFLLGLQGIGGEVDLDAMRSDRSWMWDASVEQLALEEEAES
ncbi:MAG: type II toxin-antitoxin system VapB family antitoxin [Actinobacteria bacterium]|nr:type II toxin-antitoxin system VapB family antitoxin [Actinomycetota bacterium]